MQNQTARNVKTAKIQRNRTRITWQARAKLLDDAMESPDLTGWATRNPCDHVYKTPCGPQMACSAIATGKVISSIPVLWSVATALLPAVKLSTRGGLPRSRPPCHVVLLVVLVLLFLIVVLVLLVFIVFSSSSSSSSLSLWFS